MIIAFHKPFGILSQFSGDHPRYGTLAEFGLPKNVYPIGRLDADSEGLLLLSDEKLIVDLLLNPKNEHPRTYWVQVEGAPQSQDLAPLRRGGIAIQNYRTLPCQAEVLSEAPTLPPRNPPIRYRASIPDTWVELTLTEGKNRQVRKMTAAVGFPTLRLVRAAIGKLKLGDLQPGQWSELSTEDRKLIIPAQFNKKIRHVQARPHSKLDFYNKRH